MDSRETDIRRCRQRLDELYVMQSTIIMERDAIRVALTKLRMGYAAFEINAVLQKAGVEFRI